jgi:hypothetical protein
MIAGRASGESGTLNNAGKPVLKPERCIDRSGGPLVSPSPRQLGAVLTPGG